MISTRGSGSPGGDSQEHGPIEPSTVPIPLPRPRRTPRSRTLRLARCRPRPIWPSTVWPCAQDDQCEGTGLLAEWLLTAIIKIVTNYTLPGQRVLLLDPAPYLVPPAPWPTAATGNRSRPSSYEGLHEAGWAVARLGRSIQTRTAATRRDPSGEHAADGPAKSESGPGPTTESPSADRRPGPDSTAAGDGPDRYDLIVTAADPRTLEWFCPADWGGLLAANGMLAVVTRGDRSGGRLVDPAGPLLLAAHHAGLRYLDRIALLHVPIRDGALAVANPATGTRSQAPAGGATSSVRHTQVHDDLLVFTNQPAPSGTADGEETSDA